VWLIWVQVAPGFRKAVGRNLAKGGRCFGACFRSRDVVKLGHVQVAGMLIRNKDIGHKSIAQTPENPSEVHIVLL